MGELGKVEMAGEQGSPSRQPFWYFNLCSCEQVTGSGAVE